MRVTMSDPCREALMAPLLLLSKDLHVLAASPSYFEAFHASRKSVEGHPVDKTDNGRWNVPAVRALLEKALEQDVPRASLTLSHDDPAVARVRLIAQRSFSEGRTDPVILLVIEPEGFPHQAETRRADAGLPPGCGARYQAPAGD